jgi:hypothetical protein
MPRTANSSGEEGDTLELFDLLIGHMGALEMWNNQMKEVLAQESKPETLLVTL